MWGPANDAKNVLLIPLAASGWRSRPQSNTAQPIITSRPTVWYYADGNMVKLGPELVDGRFSAVMGRRRAIAPALFRSTRSPQGRGREVYRQGKRDHRPVSRQRDDGWRSAGSCSLPALPGLEPRISLQFYQGTVPAEHWASRVKRLAITPLQEE